MFWGLSGEAILAVIGGAVALVLGLIRGWREIAKAYQEAIAELRKNTVATLNVESNIDAIQVATVDKGELEYYKLWYSAFTLSPECLPCKEAIVKYLSGRAIRASDSLITQKMIREFKIKAVEEEAKNG